MSKNLEFELFWSDFLKMDKPTNAINPSIHQTHQSISNIPQLRVERNEMCLPDVTSGSGHDTLVALNNIEKLCENLEEKSADSMFSEDDLEDDVFLNVSDPGDVTMLFNEDSMDDDCFLNISSDYENDQSVCLTIDDISADTVMEIIEEDRKVDFLNECELAIDNLTKQDVSFERQLQCAKLMSLLEPHKKPGHTRLTYPEWRVNQMTSDCPGLHVDQEASTSGQRSRAKSQKRVSSYITKSCDSDSG